MATNPKVQAPWGEYVPRVGRMTVEQFETFPGFQCAVSALFPA